MRQRGQSLIEVVVALSVATIIITSLLMIVINSLRNAQFASTQVRATKLASQAIEQIRTIRDRDGATIFRANSGVTSKFSDLWSVQMTSTCSPDPCSFRVTNDLSLEQMNQASDTESLGNGLSREVIISDTGSDYQTEKTVTVKVRWNDSAGPHESHLQTVISNFDSVVASGNALGDPVIIQPTPTSVPNPFPVSGLVSYWKMDEGSGTNVADSIGSNNGTATDGTPIVGGKIGLARRFNGTNQFVLLGERESLKLPNFSIAAWVYKETSNTYNGIYAYASGGSTGGPVFYTIPGGYLELAKAGYAKCTSTTALANNNWYFVAVTYDGSNCRFYIRINNLPFDSVIPFNYAFTYSSLAYIGTHTSDGTLFHGTIDELGIWNRALTLTEIQLLYNGGSGRQP